MKENIKMENLCYKEKIKRYKQELNELLKEIENLGEFKMWNTFEINSEKFFKKFTIKKWQNIEIIGISKPEDSTKTTTIEFKTGESEEIYALSQWIFMINFCKANSIKQDELRKKSKCLEKELEKLQGKVSWNEKLKGEVNKTKNKISKLLEMANLLKQLFLKSKKQ